MDTIKVLQRIYDKGILHPNEVELLKSSGLDIVGLLAEYWGYLPDVVAWMISSGQVGYKPIFAVLDDYEVRGWRVCLKI
jgi:hypothetical protein